MLGTCNVMAFTATADPDRARAFYRDVVGLTLVADEEHALVFDANGIMLRIQKAGEVVTPPYTTLGWRVDDIAASVTALTERGVEFLRYSFFEQDALGVWTTPDGSARIAWFRDPDGHTLSLTQF